MKADDVDSRAKETKSAEIVLIGVDWGTSSLRAYALADDGAILTARDRPKGILQVGQAGFAAVLNDTVGDWRRPGLPLLLSGMIGSRQGWIEVPYLDLPVGCDDLAAKIAMIPEDPEIHLVPGLARDDAGQAPDVMRGEETQILGAASAEGSVPELLVLPGTHSKWVLCDRGRIVWFATFMTGEIFSLLKQHSILGRLMPAEAPPQDTERSAETFRRGLAATESLPGGLLHQVFSARTLPLFNRLAPRDIEDYLSGLVIGAEIAEAGAEVERRLGKVPPITVVGAAGLAARYLTALEQLGLAGRKAPDDAAARGLSRLAKAASLLP